MKLLIVLKNIRAAKIGIAMLGFIIGVITTIVAVVAISVWAHSFAKRTQSEIHSIAQARFVRDALRQQDTLVFKRDSCKNFDTEIGDHRDGITWRYRCIGTIPGSEVQVVFWYALSPQGSVIYYEN